MSRGYVPEATYTLWVFVKRETEKAYLLFDGEADHWVPKSQIRSTLRDVGEGSVANIEVTQWIAEQKEMNVNNKLADVAPKLTEESERPEPKLSGDKPF